MTSVTSKGPQHRMEGVTVEEIKSEACKIFANKLDFNKNGFVRLQPYNQVFSPTFIPYLQDIEDFPVFDDDIWISSFPKCGTTWTQEMVWCIVNGLDFASAKQISLDERVPFFELGPLTADLGPDNPNADSMKYVAQMKRPRVIKTHLSIDMLPKQLRDGTTTAKIVYVTRNPRDACVSLFHHYKILEGYTGSFDEFFEAFIDDSSGYYTPILHHILGFWRQRQSSKPNLCFIRFEDMKSDLGSVVKEVSSFLGCPVQEALLPQLTDHLSFKQMKSNSAANKTDFVKVVQGFLTNKTEGAQFMRKGEVGDWVNHFSEDQLKKFLEWENRWLQGTGLQFDFKIRRP